MLIICFSKKLYRTDATSSLLETIVRITIC
jgi:hypothetical protein